MKRTKNKRMSKNMEKRIDRKVKIIIGTMAVLTLCWMILVVYANMSPATNEELGGIDAAFLYMGNPEQWYTPEQLNIVKIIGYSENATAIQVVYGIEGPPFETAGVIFKYEERFWQISELHIDFGRHYPLDYLRNHGFVGAVSGLIAGCWVITGIFLKKR